MKKKPSFSVSFQIWPFAIVLFLSLLAGLIFPYKGWGIILLANGLTLGYSYFMVWHLQSSIRIQREMRYGWAKVGDVLEEQIRVYNAGPIPTAWLEIIDHTNLPDLKRALGTQISAHSHTTWRTRHVCTRRGLYHLGPTTVKTSDPFGLFQLSIDDPHQMDLLITPPVVPLPNIEVASGGRMGDGRMVKGVLEPSVAVSTIRDYQPNDPLHHIHWPLTAKRDTLTTRVFENTPTGNWWIVQDMNKAVQIGEGNNYSLEIGIILSASLAKKGIQSGKAVGFVANDLQHSWITPQHQSDQIMKILHTLALSEAGDMSLNSLLKNTRSSFQQAASLILITPDMTLEWWEALLWLKAKGMIPTVLLLDPSSFDPSEATTHTTLQKLQNAGIRSYAIQSSLFADQIDVKENPLWEWRVFGTGHAVPIKKPSDLEWKQIE